MYIRTCVLYIRVCVLCVCVLNVCRVRACVFWGWVDASGSGDARRGGRGGHDAHAGLRRGHREADEAGSLQPGTAGHGAVRVCDRHADEGGQEAPRRGKLPQGAPRVTLQMRSEKRGGNPVGAWELLL